MPLKGKAKKVMKSMKDQYGDEEAERVFYATANKQGRTPETWEKKGSALRRKLAEALTPVEEMELGTKEEMEHTDDKAEAAQIAKEHLDEDPDYYEKLQEAGLVDAKLANLKRKLAAAKKAQVDDPEAFKPNFEAGLRNPMIPALGSGVAGGLFGALTGGVAAGSMRGAGVGALTGGLALGTLSYILQKVQNNAIVKKRKELYGMLPKQARARPSALGQVNEFVEEEKDEPSFFGNLLGGALIGGLGGAALGGGYGAYNRYRDFNEVTGPQLATAYQQSLGPKGEHAMPPPYYEQLQKRLDDAGGSPGGAAWQGFYQNAWKPGLIGAGTGAALGALKYLFS